MTREFRLLGLGIMKCKKGEKGEEYPIGDATGSFGVQ